jgi:hypothetical protein
MEIKKETKYKVKPTNEAERDLDNAADKVKAGAKAVANKMEDAARDASYEVDKAGREVEHEYRKEKIKRNLD